MHFAGAHSCPWWTGVETWVKELVWTAAEKAVAGSTLLKKEWYKITLELASFPGSPHAHKWQKAGRGLGTRLPCNYTTNSYSSCKRERDGGGEGRKMHKVIHNYLCRHFDLWTEAHQNGNEVKCTNAFSKNIRTPLAVLTYEHFVRSAL